MTNTKTRRMGGYLLALGVIAAMVGLGLYYNRRNARADCQFFRRSGGCPDPTPWAVLGIVGIGAIAIAIVVLMRHPTPAENPAD